MSFKSLIFEAFLLTLDKPFKCPALLSPSIPSSIKQPRHLPLPTFSDHIEFLSLTFYLIWLPNKKRTSYSLSHFIVKTRQCFPVDKPLIKDGDVSSNLLPLQYKVTIILKWYFPLSKCWEDLICSKRLFSQLNAIFTEVCDVWYVKNKSLFKHIDNLKGLKVISCW